jgi:hypothetical protein
MDASKQNIDFGDKNDQFFIGTSNIPPAGVDYVNDNGLNPVATIDFLNHSFKNGGRVDLGFDFDNSLVGFLGINSGLLFGTKVSATLHAGGHTTTVTGQLGGPTGRGYAVNDGFGLIDGFAAFRKLSGGSTAGK